MWQQVITPTRKIMKSSPTLLTFKEKYEVTTVEMNFSTECETQEFFDAIKLVIAVAEIERKYTVYFRLKKFTFEFCFNAAVNKKRDKIT
jgi:hypothetical protein